MDNTQVLYLNNVATQYVDISNDRTENDQSYLFTLAVNSYDTLLKWTQGDDNVTPRFVQNYLASNPDNFYFPKIVGISGSTYYYDISSNIYNYGDISGELRLDVSGIEEPVGVRDFDTGDIFFCDISSSYGDVSFNYDKKCWIYDPSETLWSTCKDISDSFKINFKVNGLDISKTIIIDINSIIEDINFELYNGIITLNFEAIGVQSVNVSFNFDNNDISENRITSSIVENGDNKFICDASFNIVGGDTGSTIGYTINYVDLAGRDLSKNGGYISFNFAKPILSNISIESNNANKLYAISGDEVTIKFSSNLPIPSPEVQLYNSADVPSRFVLIGTVGETYGNTRFTSKYIVNQYNYIDPNGVLLFKINYSTPEGIDGDQVTNDTNGVTGSVTIDNSASIVDSVTSTNDNGIYKVGETILIQVVFNENVYVTGTPQLKLTTNKTSSNTRFINYDNGSGTEKLNFNYTVLLGDKSDSLDYDASNSLVALNGATIKDAAGNHAVLTLKTPGSSGSLGDNKSIEIDGAELKMIGSPEVSPGTVWPPWIKLTFNYPVSYDNLSLSFPTPYREYSVYGESTRKGDISGNNYVVTYDLSFSSIAPDGIMNVSFSGYVQLHTQYYNKNLSISQSVTLSKTIYKEGEFLTQNSVNNYGDIKGLPLYSNVSAPVLISMVNDNYMGEDGENEIGILITYLEGIEDPQRFYIPGNYFPAKRLLDASGKIQVLQQYGKNNLFDSGWVTTLTNDGFGQNDDSGFNWYWETNFNNLLSIQFNNQNTINPPPFSPWYEYDIFLEE